MARPSFLCLFDLFHSLPVRGREVEAFEVDPGKLSSGIDVLAMERKQFRVPLTQEIGAAVVRDPVHPGLEEEKAVTLEEALLAPVWAGLVPLWGECSLG